MIICLNLTHNTDILVIEKSGDHGVHFLVIYRFDNHKGCILIIFFLVPLSNIMCLFTHVYS